MGTPLARLSAASDVTDSLTPPGVGPGDGLPDRSEFPTPFHGPAPGPLVPTPSPRRSLGFDLVADLACIAGRLQLARAAAGPGEAGGVTEGQNEDAAGGHPRHLELVGQVGLVLLDHG